jgi:N-methylhydantoinase A/oxoprolinase/acetone carboxylase beta subunit
VWLGEVFNLLVDQGDGTLPRPMVDRALLAAGATVTGPAVLVGVDSTVVVAPWQHGAVDDHGALHLEERS